MKQNKQQQNRQQSRDLQPCKYTVVTYDGAVDSLRTVTVASMEEVSKIVAAVPQPLFRVFKGGVLVDVHLRPVTAVIVDGATHYVDNVDNKE